MMAVWVLGNPNQHQGIGMKRGMASQRNENIQARREARQNQNTSKPLKGGSINMSTLGGNQDTILFRKQLARKRALKVVSDAWAGDKKIDMDIQERKAHIQELQADIKESRGFIDEGNARKEELEKAQNEVISENASIRGIRLERLKHHDMIDAQKTADEINEAASKEAIGMLVGEAKEIMDEIREEKREAAKKKAEEKEEQEEKIEEQREEREELQEQLELRREENAEFEETGKQQRKNAREQADLLEEAEEYAVDPSTNTSQIKAEIKNMLHKMKLLEEDLKGAKVDDIV